MYVYKLYQTLKNKSTIISTISTFNLANESATSFAHRFTGGYGVHVLNLSTSFECLLITKVRP